MNRRDFVAQSAVAASTLLVPRQSSKAQMKSRQPIIAWAGIPSTPPPQFIIESTFNSQRFKDAHNPPEQRFMCVAKSSRWSALIEGRSIPCPS